MPAGALACCCLPKCPSPNRCGTFDVEICAEGACDPLPPVTVVIGPGSTVKMSMTATVLLEDFKLYSTTGGPWTPKDPGKFGDESIRQPCDPFEHPYDPTSEEWAHGRKVRKTVISFEDAVFQWLPLSPGSCTYGWSAKRIPCMIGVAAAITESGVPETPATTHAELECDQLEAVTCDLVLGVIGDTLWCPGGEGQFTMLVSATRSDGLPFEPLTNEDWDDEFHAELPEEFPGLDLLVQIAPDRTILQVMAPLEPTGALGNLAASMFTVTQPDDVSSAVSTTPQTPYIGYARQRSSMVSASMRMSIVNDDCVDNDDCLECLAADIVNGDQLSCLGATVTLSSSCEGDCEGFESVVYLWQRRLTCTSGVLSIDWYIWDQDTEQWVFDTASNTAGVPVAPFSSTPLWYPHYVGSPPSDCHLCFEVIMGYGGPTYQCPPPPPPLPDVWYWPKDGGSWSCSLNPGRCSMPAAGAYEWVVFNASEEPTATVTWTLTIG